MSELAGLIRRVPDYPTPGVLFRDLTPLWADSQVFHRTVVELSKVNQVPDVVMGIEARGFIFAAPMALHLGAAFVPLRKPGKLPGPSHRVEFDLEYGSAVLEVQEGACGPGSRVLVVDDVLATGGTTRAAAELVDRLDCQLVGISVLLELADLGGRALLEDAGIGPVHSLVRE
ncbi:adenine phosphoribosyltransferase [Parenemella sanctibonifatiensis]|uniref:Adenine phosphoribosyltransferase n=1 Tax=Parenemella sanctibonifatiensis TaxID=2016505 RepID=A0A255ENI3_9ACTN|nr:adenine phosphoribosyltransferase [Parenemella sanctibonifatiensis]OYN91022.1 adenine phosphoribosyltransferase [Parenemella sanctibonifatiensis]